jgi:hypothetical protein
LKVCFFFLADVRTGFRDSGSTESIVRLLLRVCEAMAGVFWGVVSGLKVGIRISYELFGACSTRPESRLSGVFLRVIRPSHWSKS